MRTLDPDKTFSQTEAHTISIRMWIYIDSHTRPVVTVESSIISDAFNKSFSVSVDQH